MSVTVSLPSADWELIMLMLHENQSHSPVAHSIYRDIWNQIAGQEY